MLSIVAFMAALVLFLWFLLRVYNFCKKIEFIIISKFVLTEGPLVQNS